MSVESGVPLDSPPRADATRFLLEPDVVVAEYARWREQLNQARPHPGHAVLRALKRPILTLNVDGLLQKAGCEAVLELHGSVWRNRCQLCARPADVDQQRCHCGGRLRPDVVWDHEALAWDVVEQARQWLDASDCLVCVGTSASRLPVSDFPLEARRRGVYVLEINPEATALTPHCNESWRGQASELLPRLGMGEASSHR